MKNKAQEKKTLIDEIISLRNERIKRWKSNSDIIELEKIKVDFGLDSIFDNLNLKIKSDEKNMIIGEKDSGKTLLLNLINKGITPTKGNVKIFSKNINDFSYYDFKQNVSFLDTKEVLNQNRTVYKELTHSLKSNFDWMVSKERESEVSRLNIEKIKFLKVGAPQEIIDQLTDAFDLYLNVKYETMYILNNSLCPDDWKLIELKNRIYFFKNELKNKIIKLTEDNQSKIKSLEEKIKLIVIEINKLDKKDESQSLNINELEEERIKLKENINKLNYKIKDRITHVKIKYKELINEVLSKYKWLKSEIKNNFDNTETNIKAKKNAKILPQLLFKRFKSTFDNLKDTYSLNKDEVLKKSIQDKIEIEKLKITSIKDAIKNEVNNISEVLDIKKILNKKISGLNNSEKIALLIAREAVKKPKILLIDDLNKDLKDWETKTLINYIRKLNKIINSTIISTSTNEKMKCVCDNVFVINDKKISIKRNLVKEKKVKNASS